MSLSILTKYLLHKGHRLAIENGRLRVESARGNEVPEDWLENDQQQIVSEILDLTGATAWVFQGYSTGRYRLDDSGTRRAEGVTLRFQCPSTQATSYAIFNAELTRARNSKHGKAGSPLPPGQFRVGENHLFYTFWKKAGLKIPKRLSSFHDYMGNLKELLFTGSFKKDERLDAKSLEPLNLTCQQLIEAFDCENLPDKRRTTPGQLPDNSRTRVPDKKNGQAHIQQDFQPISTTGKNKYGNKVIRKHGYTGNSSIPVIPKKPEEQSHDEWLAEYSSFE